MTAFTLELYYEHDEDREFTKLKAPLDIDRPKATNIFLLVARATSPVIAITTSRTKIRVGKTGSPSLITREDFGVPGLAGPHRGCLNRKLMMKMIESGGNSANITIHEWLHTIQGREVNGWSIPCADSSAAYGFSNPTGDDHGSPTWHEWFRFALSGKR